METHSRCSIMKPSNQMNPTVGFNTLYIIEGIQYGTFLHPHLIVKATGFVTGNQSTLNNLKYMQS